MSFCCAKPYIPSWSCEATPLDVKTPVPSDINIAKSVTGKPIKDLCKQINVKEFDQYGPYKAKIKYSGSYDVISQRGSYVVVTGVTPTSFGEGKSTTTIGLVQALTAHLKRNSIACIRQPSQGPTFGMKGGAAGGGYSQIWPMEEFNMHLTGDIHAVTAANNLIAAAIDARMFHEATQSDEDLFKRLINSKDGPTFTKAQKRRLEKLGIPSTLKPDELNNDQKRLFARLDIDPGTITLCRVIDTNDRFLRKITIGQSHTEKNMTRETKFAISVVSELMAILSLAIDFNDVCERVNKMVIGFTKVSATNLLPRPVTCEDLCVAGAVCVLIKEAVHPTIVQTLEGSPVLVHCGPFANIAHGNSSIVADKIALNLVGPEGFVVTEAGFGSDVGFEKFMDIKCHYSKLMPDCAVLVTTVRAIKSHGSAQAISDLEVSDDVLIERGLSNLKAHIKNITMNFNVPVVVALNKFTSDKDHELASVRQGAISAGASDCCLADNWAQGGKGAVELAKSVVETCSKQKITGKKAKFLYNHESLSIIEKIKTIATNVYGATDVNIPEDVGRKINLLEANGFGKLPICIAKTALSISHDPKVKGAPSDYIFPIESVNVSAGAGFVYALAGEISTMPGLPTRPAFFDITVDPQTGEIDGLF